MTRIGGYSLLACPICKAVHKRARYASVSVYTPKGINDTPDAFRQCAKCRASFALGDMVVMGEVRNSLLTAEEIMSIAKYGTYKEPFISLTLLDKLKMFFGLYKTESRSWEALIGSFPEIS